MRMGGYGLSPARLSLLFARDEKGAGDRVQIMQSPYCRLSGLFL